jgi:predicted O-methyltransferase YrrM
LNSRFTQHLRLAGQFIRFLWLSGNRYSIHSPFLYDLVGEVLRSNNKEIPCRKEIEELRKQCLKSRQVIMKTDFGKGSREKTGSRYPVTLRTITRLSVTPARHARRLHRLALKIKAENILEIGTSIGLTTAYLACANQGSRIITLEGCPSLGGKAREHFDRLGVRNAEIIEGKFEDTLPVALTRLKRVDLVYIDGNHRKDAMLDYYEKCRAYAGNDTVFVFDDIHASGEMEQAWDIITKKEEVKISLDLFFSGWIFFRRESSRQHFRLRYI